MSDFSASIIITTHNRAAFLPPLLESINKSVGGAPVEILVVDDASTDNTVEVIRQQFPKVTLLQNASNLGPSAGRNRGAAAAAGAFLYFLDSDGVVAPAWFEAMGHEAAPNRVLLGNVADFEGGRVQSVPRRATFIGKSLPCDPERANTGPSCNLGIDRALFEDLGGFDEDIPYYFEDSDLCIRAGCAGATFKFIPDAIFRHHGTEYKRGQAIRMQEHNASFAMLKLYGREPRKLVAFFVANLAWLALRIPWWLLRGRFRDTLLLVEGWTTAHLRFLSWRKGG